MMNTLFAQPLAKPEKARRSPQKRSKRLPQNADLCTLDIGDIHDTNEMPADENHLA